MGLLTRRAGAVSVRARRVTVRYRGFTLIELLVVIAVIAILAAILFPVFAKARETATMSNCASNEKQLGMAMLAYSDDWKGALPMAWWPNRPPTKKFGLWIRLYLDDVLPYVNNYKIFLCGARQKMVTSWEASRGEYDWSYTANPFLNGADGKAWTQLALIRNPSKKIILSEWINGYVTINFDRLDWTTRRGVNPGAPSVRSDDDLLAVNTLHFGRPNWLLADGHVKSLTPRQTVVPSFMFNLRDQYPVSLPGPNATVASEKDVQTRICHILTYYKL